MTLQPTNPSSDATNYPHCVEHGVWTPIPLPPPSGPLRLKLKEVDPDESPAVKKRGVMTFHLIGCTGHFNQHVPVTKVVKGMAKQIADPDCFGSKAEAVAPSFLFHLGDIVYKPEKPGEPAKEIQPADPQKTDQDEMYNSQFYGCFTKYTRSIFAIAGNHDGKDSDNPKKSAIQHFLKNFCASKRKVSSNNQTDDRTAMIQPYPYWMLDTPLAHIISLYANDINGGQLDDPTGSDRPQYDWLLQTLKDIKEEADGKAVFVAVHYPPYSGAGNFAQRGDPNLGPTKRTRPLEPLGMILQRAFRESGQYPDAVFSAHAHLYQRITYTHADGRQVPYLIVGCGGHWPIENLAVACDQTPGQDPQVPCDTVSPPGLTLPPGDSARLVAYDDKDFGFLRLTLDMNRKTLAGEFFACYNDKPDATGLPALKDWFILDLKQHQLR